MHNTAPEAGPRLKLLATVVSGLGHPLLTAALFVGAVASRQSGTWVAGAVVGGVVLPVAAWNYWRVRRGQYTNFDVSAREQRHSFYPVLLTLLALATGSTWLVGTPIAWRAGLAVALGLILLCYLLNFRLKVSLHAALSFFLAGGVGLLAGAGWGLGAALLAGLVAASRLVLRRHTGPEVLVGASVGIGAAGVLGWLLG
ncbi:hypothetical protein [Hymenobacter jeollabukensis]|uniref:Phosphatase PAP2 family protein n=1 Tax=Hymenobacter jeollabukensis TaxID=2025313 RepID=A0A5R8WJY9_9BACT|nr:hypothetical protein [Hymenobacter jeollabukensis]TLM89156.1 hypothetical protein FDY95_21540 [Hymenobacter jeollabukensis]